MSPACLLLACCAYAALQAAKPDFPATPLPCDYANAKEERKKVRRSKRNVAAASPVAAGIACSQLSRLVQGELSVALSLSESSARFFLRELPIKGNGSGSCLCLSLLTSCFRSAVDVSDDGDDIHVRLPLVV